MDVSAVVLNKLLIERNIELYSKLKLVFLDPSYSTLYSVIAKHYEKYSSIPSFEDLEISLREGQTTKTLASLKILDTQDIESEVALNALIDQYTQNETIKLLDKFIDKLPLYDTNEIKENLSSIALNIEEKTHTSESVFNMSELLVFQKDEDIAKDRVYLGLNNGFDAMLGGMARQEVLFLGGKRGDGKSIVSSNLFINQYEIGNSCLYFSIEMTAFETYQRNMAILAGVNIQNLKQNKLTSDELLRVVNARANMYTDSSSVLSEFMSHRDQYRFEEDLVRNCSLKPDNQMVIVDDRSLTIGSIDLHIGKAKAKFGEKLGVVVVDYLNQIVIEGGQYDWQPQIEISKKLKNLARKYEVIIVSPYQIDDSGTARFAKGILDAADISLLLKTHSKETGAISFTSNKTRGSREIEFTCPINWDTLKISPQSIESPEAAKKPATNKKDKESDIDLPWDA